MPVVVDAHEDIAWNALAFGRDVTRSAEVTRQLEQGTHTPHHNGSTLLGLDDYLRGGVAVIFATLFAAPFHRRVGDWDTLVYKNRAEAHKLYSSQLDYYHRLADRCRQFTLISRRGDLDAVLASWQPGADPAARHVGLVPLMEGADGIREPEEAEMWMERGVRIIGLTWGATRYGGGTAEPGPLTDDGRRLLDVMSGLSLTLDLSHASEETFFEAIDRFEGAVIVSHANPRALLNPEPRHPERHLSDDMIRRLAERGGVVGLVPLNRFIKSGWRPADGRHTVTLEHVAAMIDYVCQLTGSADHVGIGSDFDGTFGRESTPAEIDTVADLALVGDVLKRRGYTESQVAGVLADNWLRVLRRGLPA